MIRTAAAATLLLLSSLACGAEEAPERNAETPRTASSPGPGGGTGRTADPSGPTADPTRPTAAATTAARAQLIAPPPAERPVELARRLTAAEDLVRDPAAAGDQVRRAAFEAQLLYRQLAARAEWLRTVLDALPERYRAATRAHVEAQQSLRSMHTTLSDQVPAWRIADPAPRGVLLTAYREAERRFGVNWEVLAAINLVETRMGRIRSASVAGARGPMQFIPETWAAYGEGDIDDPRDAILAAARYLAARGAVDGRMDEAIYAYNNHPAYVAAIQSYAGILADDPAAFRGLYHWQVLYLTEIGTMWLPVGYRRDTAIPGREYAARHPERHLDTGIR